ncbi:hypothetical protein SAMN05444398_1116 [Roseovarius pacificus]|uniref:Thiolase, N-terminal domain n=1 Tax=Roseovarius pacificus TaxID=337701 RepID=A0A1M7GLZ9_9RHOB|nr:hypothetical protein [Roseovarius pacificus]GGO60415.1 hypothetical protein GCM10011315_34820 [Roseovarius pacificus]SHM17195.1 hypothetical protein SAMN05444398_1116 [Roseovarius pacificus]
MKDVFICDYIRTPIGRFSGTLSGGQAVDLAAMCIGIGQGISVALERV